MEEKVRTQESSVELFDDQWFMVCLLGESKSGFPGQSKSDDVTEMCSIFFLVVSYFKEKRNIYTEKGVYAVSLTAPVRDVLGFDLGEKVEKRIEALLEELVSWVSEREEVGRARGLLFPTFSITGWLESTVFNGFGSLIYGAILDYLQSRGDFMDKIKGCVIDSGGDPEIDPQGTVDSLSLVYVMLRLFVGSMPSLMPCYGGMYSVLGWRGLRSSGVHGVYFVSLCLHINQNFDFIKKPYDTGLLEYAEEVCLLSGMSSSVFLVASLYVKVPYLGLPDLKVWAAGFSAALLKKRSSATLPSEEAIRHELQIDDGISKLQETEPLLVETLLLSSLEKFFSFVLKLPDVNRRFTKIISTLSKSQPSCPQLYLYSTADKVMPFGPVEMFMQEQKMIGRKVNWCLLIYTAIKMNDLMTKSFLSYVDLKKLAMKDLEAGPDMEIGQLDPRDEENLTQFFEEVSAVKTEMEAISTLLLDLQELNEETKSTHSAKVLRGLRDRMDSNMVTVLRKAKIIKARLESLDQSNVANRTVSIVYSEGSPVDRTRMSVTNGLRIKLRDMMNDFQALRNRIVTEHKEGLKRRYYNATGKVATDEEIDKLVSVNGQVKVFAGHTELDLENLERQEAVKEIQRSLTELHQVFLDMAVLVDAQGEQMDDIELNVANARVYISGGTNRLISANAMKKKGGYLVYWIWAAVAILLLICIIKTAT
ncbi:hypothetical protein IFM89_017701 [Coptis chinensis]|uniref:t-SNARE coiled-coil homology domain-containing protein n=1 Tax=Coptis chinensis TaxID=261450 RepID=A0A835I308_9MAGN|nr:hypothetical protein IFM89_017701 [Coptis chinensis]